LFKLNKFAVLHRRRSPFIRGPNIPCSDLSSAVSMGRLSLLLLRPDKYPNEFHWSSCLTRLIQTQLKSIRQILKQPPNHNGPPSLLYDEHRVIPGAKAAKARRWPPTPSSAEVKERVQLYLYSSFWTFVACSRADSTFFTPNQNSNKILPVISGIKDRRASLYVLLLMQSRRVKNGWSVKLTINLLILLTVGWPKCTGPKGENTRVDFYILHANHHIGQNWTTLNV